MRGEVGVAAALADAVERALDLAHAGAHGHQRVGDRVLRVVVGVDAEMRAGHVLRHLGDDALDLVRQRAAVGVAQHDPARAGLVGRARRRPAHSRGCPCSRRKNARSRSWPRGSLFDIGLHRLSDALEVLLVGDAERHAHVIVPRLGDQADGVGLGLQRGLEARIVGRPSVRLRLVMPKAVSFADSSSGIGAEELRIGRRWRRDSRPRCSRRRARRACAAIRRLSSREKSTPVVCAPSRSVVSKR